MLNRRIWSLVFIVQGLVSCNLAFKPLISWGPPGHSEITRAAFKQLGMCSDNQDHVYSIQEWNRNVDGIYAFKSSAHCDNEKLLECSLRVQLMVNEMFANVDMLDVVYGRMQELASSSALMQSVEYPELLRKKNLLYAMLSFYIGNALHTVQDFYSHSNFVEKELAGFQQDLVIFDSILLDPSLDAKYCPTENNILDPSVPGYTTGYFAAVTPTGKCIHGEPFLRNGINKDTPDKTNYQLAYDRATTASVHFLKSILKKFNSERKQRIFTGCITFPTLGQAEIFAAAIDSTGSMRYAISGVKSWINTYVLSGKAKFRKFVTVLFNDPFVEEVRTFYNATEYLSFVNSIAVMGGDDCPELMYTGIEKLALSVDKGTSIYVFSDADAKDLAVKRDIVRSLVQEKNLKLNFVLSGNCGISARRRRRSVEALTAKSSTQLDAESLASLSGGVVVDSSTADVTTSLEIARNLQNAVFNIVKIGILPGTCSNVSFPILQAGSNVSIVLRHNLSSLLSGNNKLLIYDPLNNLMTSALYLQTLQISLITLVDVALTGVWKMQFCYAAEYQISSTEDINLSVEILDLLSGLNILQPIKGNPLVGKSYSFNVQLDCSTDLVDTSVILTLVDSSGTSISTKSLQYNVTKLSYGRRTFGGQLDVPSVAFSFRITAQTSSGLPMERMTNKVLPVLVQMVPQSPSIQLADNNATFLTFTLVNQGSASYTLTLNTGASQGLSFIKTVSLMNSSSVILLPTSSKNLVVQLTPNPRSNCSQNYTDSESIEVFLSAVTSSASTVISGSVKIRLPCSATATLPKGCLFLEDRGSCDDIGKRTFNITIIQTPDLGGAPCPTQLVGVKECLIAAAMPASTTSVPTSQPNGASTIDSAWKYAAAGVVLAKILLSLCMFD